MTTINTQYSNNIYLLLEGSKIVDKASFLIQISKLLNFPDYFGHNWDALDECLGDIVSIWRENNPSYIKSISDSNGILLSGSKVNVIWTDSIFFSKNNNSDFLIAIDILKSITENDFIPLRFILRDNVTNIVNIKTELFK